MHNKEFGICVNNICGGGEEVCVQKTLSGLRMDRELRVQSEV